MTRSPLHRQRGAALLTALIIVTLVVTLAAAMVWQQWRAVQVEAAERARLQSSWILQGALDWARLILREDERSGRPTALTEPWATPLAESRLSTFLAADKNNNADTDGPEAFLSGAITDAQARFNLANLVDGNGKISQPGLEALERLCQTVGLSTDLAARIAAGLRDAKAGASGAALQPRTFAQLAWLGVDAASIAALQPYATLLPISTRVNVNTAPREVLAAVIKGLDLATAERLVQLRQRDPFKDQKAVEARMPNLAQLDLSQIEYKSKFFEVRGRLRLEDRVLEQRSLIERRGLDMLVLQREQVSTVEGVRS